MKKILVPIDFSDCAAYALEFAANMARKTQAELLLLHVLDVPALQVNPVEGQWATNYSGGSQLTPFTVKLLEITGERMQNFISNFNLEGITVHDGIEVGSVSNHVMDAVEKHNADIIIMGTHGSSGMDEYFIGSNAEKVVRKSHLPVITMQTKLEGGNISKILFASDFSDEAKRVYPAVRNFADIFNAEIHLVKITSSDDVSKSTDSIMRFMNDINHQHSYKIIKDKSKEKGIIKYANDINADIIALGTHGRGGISRFFNASVAEDIVNHSCLPVLTLNIED